MSEERVQKILARAGIASRRAAEALITAGRVTIDGRTIRELGTQADPERQRIEVDGRRVGAEPLQYLVLHKPREVVSTLHDPAGRSTVAELVAGAGARVVPVGRLDYHTSGVLLFSNDGLFSKALLHPSAEVPREYILKVKGPVDYAGMDRLRDSIVIDGRRTQPAEVRLERNEGDKVWLMVTLKEGRNRHVRRLVEQAGYRVMRLARLSFAGITAEGLAPGMWRALTQEELTELKRLHGVPKQIPTRVAAPAAHEPERGTRARPRRQATGKPVRGSAASRAYEPDEDTRARPRRQAAGKAGAGTRGPARTNKAGPPARAGSRERGPGKPVHGVHKPRAAARADWNEDAVGKSSVGRRGPTRASKKGAPARAEWHEDGAGKSSVGRRGPTRASKKGAPARAGSREHTSGKPAPPRSPRAPSRGSASAGPRGKRSRPSSRRELP
jgi:23S rRNA pseudouridine2605 synthase